MMRRPVPQKPAPKAKPEQIAAIKAAKAHYQTGQTFLSDAELLDLATSLEARHAATRAADARMIEAAFAELEGC